MTPTIEQIKEILAVGKNKPESVRHQNIERNRLLNTSLPKLCEIINNHNPEVDAPIPIELWNHLDEMLLKVELELFTTILAQHEEIAAKAAEIERLKDEQAEVAARAVDGDNSNWFVHDPETGFEEFNTYTEAKEFADSCVDDYLDECWAEEVEGLCIGVITHRATKTNIKHHDGGEFDYTCDYELMPVQVREQSK